MPRTPDRDRPTSAHGRWLLLIQQLPTRPSSARIKLWRRLQQLGSVVLKNSVYVLPNTPQAREDFEWLSAEIRAAKGHASILLAEALTTEQAEDIRQAFRAARAIDYNALRAKAQDLLRTSPARPTGTRRQALERAVRACRDELARIESIDFCGSPARATAAAVVDALAAKVTATSMRRPPVSPVAPALKPQIYRRRIWVTRPRPGVDRLACAWLIQRFIDPAARFAFADLEAEYVPRRQIPFDMYGAEFGHHGDHCTFETLCDRFGIGEPAVRRLGQVVHDVDLKDHRYSPSEASMVASLIEGLQATYKDDHELMQHGIALFAGLYESFVQPAATSPQGRRKRPARPRTGRARR